MTGGVPRAGGVPGPWGQVVRREHLHRRVGGREGGLAWMHWRRVDQPVSLGAIYLFAYYKASDNNIFHVAMNSSSLS